MPSVGSMNRLFLLGALLLPLGIAGCATQVPSRRTATPVAAASSPAAAEPLPAAAEAARYRKETVYNFEEDADPADATGPQIDVVDPGPRPAKFKPLLKEKYLRNNNPPPPTADIKE